MVRLAGVLVEQDGEVRVASVRNEPVGDVRYVVTGFLQDDCVESSASGGNDLGGIPARWSWIPLQNGEATLMMHEVTVRVVKVAESSRFGQSESYHGQDEWSTTSAWICTGGRVGSRQGGTCTPLWAAVERVGCGPTWVVLTCGCGDEAVQVGKEFGA